MCILYERNLEYNNEVYVCYIDYEKAFDQQVAKTGDGLFTACIIGRGVRQGQSLSLLLYLIYGEGMIREATDNL